MLLRPSTGECLDILPEEHRAPARSYGAGGLRERAWARCFYGHQQANAGTPCLKSIAHKVRSYGNRRPAGTRLGAMLLPLPTGECLDILPEEHRAQARSYGNRRPVGVRLGAMLLRLAGHIRKNPQVTAGFFVADGSRLARRDYSAAAAAAAALLAALIAAAAATSSLMRAALPSRPRR